jgi:hypothetical protein
MALDMRSMQFGFNPQECHGTSRFFIFLLLCSVVLFCLGFQRAGFAGFHYGDTLATRVAEHVVSHEG